ncbi:MAG: cell division protein FtsZ [Phenylobacterium sp.]|uniref:cell division protein FtsZ n=1 Tax=Phenylobacterium sp. TaxID=1871053 RepID=UPI00271CFDB4|nr:cell division protein FtsZ [Phenylobacterium sp.]MDO8910670.1 cell division protein FtsZ [Phenylobacterium sp.]MDP2012175.1 cell division protein FtsZ [Phenylobacterium sp.]MDP3102569.1 cell division protein FtsZ [Phenylobacterium sp.]HQT53837.1 cell division protein FtsZ [Phenylobacterium sp.]
MAIALSAPRATELKPRIVVFGIGGAGGNAVNNMIEAGLEGVEFVVANTDAQQLSFSKTDRRIQLGVQVTQGLGAGAHPEVGMSAAEESIPEIGEHLDGAHMVFITAGMGGGTGTGAAPIIAKCARERGILTVGVVTKPFHFEGRHRMRLADAGISELQRYVDTLIVIPNQNLFRVANERTTFAEAFGMADQVLHSGVRSITDLMVLPGLINLDFADVRTVMTEMGKAMMGTGEASGEDRALMAAQNAIQNPLLDEVSLKGAKAVLVNVTGGLDMTLLEVDEAANAISEQVDPEGNIIFGAAFDPTLEGMIRVSVVATGMDGASIAAIEPKVERRPLTAPPLRATEQAHQPYTPPPVPAPEPVRSIYATPAAQAPAPRYEAPAYRAPVAAAPAPAPTPAPKASFDEDLEAQGDLYAAAPAPTPAPAPVRVEPQITQAAAPPPAPPMTRIVDPSVADDEDEPLFADAAFEDRRPQRSGGFLSLFGSRPRYDAPAPAPAARPAARGGAQPAEAPAPQEQVDGQEDLEIPSFLRRLAN